MCVSHPVLHAKCRPSAYVTKLPVLKLEFYYVGIKKCNTTLPPCQPCKRVVLCMRRLRKRLNY
jgi:hypothetical protein